jgi:hypothetical protein
MEYKEKILTFLKMPEISTYLFALFINKNILRILFDFTLVDPDFYSQMKLMRCEA